MTTAQARALILADDEQFERLASEYDFDLTGPSTARFFLIRDRKDGKAFLFTPHPREAKPAHRKRTLVSAVWSARTLKIINSQQPDQKLGKRPPARVSEVERDLDLALIV